MLVLIYKNNLDHLLIVEIRLILCKFPDMRYPVKDLTHIRELFL